jgi:hypothetical protein
MCFDESEPQWLSRKKMPSTFFLDLSLLAQTCVFSFQVLDAFVGWFEVALPWKGF